MAEIVYPPIITLAKTLFRAWGLRLDCRGAEHIPHTGGAVLAINHVGYLDFVFAGLAAQPARRLVRFMAKTEIFTHPAAGPLMRGMHHIPVDRSAGAGSFGEALKALRAGEVIGVFPEATISVSYELKDFKMGAARLAADAGVPLVPVVVWGTQRIMTKGHKPRLGRSRAAVSMAVGEPLHPKRDDAMGEVTGELKARMQALLTEVQERYPDQPAGPEDGWWQPARLGGSAPTREQAREIEAAATRARVEARRRKAQERARLD